MNSNLLQANIEELKKRFPKLADKILQADYCSDYADEFIRAKTGELVPILNNGKALYSKYNPLRDVERLFKGDENFVLFCGLGSGIQLKYFLKHFPDKHCGVIDAKLSNLKTLFSRFDFTEIISNERLCFFSPASMSCFEEEFIQSYVPILHGNFTVKILRTWEDFYKDEVLKLGEKIQNGIKKIQSDVSTQTKFGKIWMRNIFFNLQTASRIEPSLPKVDTKKTAYILGAGPSLENVLEEIKADRDSFVLFATDTAFSVLNSAKIEADFFISIDPQIISYAHCFKDFNKNCIGIFDLCSNPITIRRFKENGNPFFFVAGGHPLAQLASQFSPFPNLLSTGGTVAITARLAALALGFEELKYAGLDFAYTFGKAYSRGTYLSELFLKSADKLSPYETKFTDLMFRTPVEKNIEDGRITYKSELLDFYKNFFYSSENEDVKNNLLWKKEDFKTFPYKQFIAELNNFASTDSDLLKTVFLPYFAYKSAKNEQNTKNFFNLELVLYQISRYTIK